MDEKGPWTSLKTELGVILRGEKSIEYYDPLTSFLAFSLFPYFGQILLEEGMMARMKIDIGSKQNGRIPEVNFHKAW